MARFDPLTRCTSEHGTAKRPFRAGAAGRRPFLNTKELQVEQRSDDKRANKLRDHPRSPLPSTADFSTMNGDREQVARYDVARRAAMSRFIQSALGPTREWSRQDQGRSSYLGKAMGRRPNGCGAAAISNCNTSFTLRSYDV